MAYQIRYQWQKEQELQKKHGFSPGTVLAVLSVITVFIIFQLYPNTGTVIRQFLYPLFDPETAETFAEMVHRVRDGVPVPEALTAFCLGILEHAG